MANFMLTGRRDPASILTMRNIKFPLFLSVAGIFEKKMKDCANVGTLQEYINLLTAEVTCINKFIYLLRITMLKQLCYVVTNDICNLYFQAIDWQPYAVLPNDFIPERYRRQLDIRTSRTCLITFHKVAHYQPELAPQQFGHEAFVGPFHELPSLKETIQRSGSNSRDWLDFGPYKPFLASWEGRHDTCVWPGKPY